MVRCRACGGEHRLHGRLSAAPGLGDVVLAGYRYSPEDFVWISSDREPAGVRRFTWALPYVGGVAALAAYVQFLRR
jgi:hypothetical protein